MKKNFMIYVMAVMFAFMVSFSTVGVSFAEETEEDDRFVSTFDDPIKDEPVVNNYNIKEQVKIIEKQYKPLVDAANKAWGEEAMNQMNYQITAFFSNGKIVEAMVLSQIMSFNIKDISRCANGNSQRIRVLQMGDNYDSMSREILSMMDSSDQQAIRGLLEKVKRYCSSTKTRASNFSNTCKNKVLSSRK